MKICISFFEHSVIFQPDMLVFRGVYIYIYIYGILTEYLQHVIWPLW